MEGRALDVFKSQIFSDFWEGSLGSVTSSDWFFYFSPNPRVYCRALWLPSSGPLGYLGWHSAWDLLPFLLMHLHVPSHCILQKQVLILHTLLGISSYWDAPFADCCAQPSLLCLQFGLWFWVSLFFFHFGCPEVHKELLTTHGKLRNSEKHSMQSSCLPSASFPVPCSFLLGVAENTGSLGFGSSAAAAAFRQCVGLDLPDPIAAEPDGAQSSVLPAQLVSPMIVSSSSPAGTCSSVSCTCQLLPAFPRSPSLWDNPSKLSSFLYDCSHCLWDRFLHCLIWQQASSVSIPRLLFLLDK